MRRCVFLLAAVLLVGCGGVSRVGYVAMNEALAASLPVFPGAAKTHELSSPYVTTEGGLSTRPVGYRTTVVYRVPRGTAGASVLRFYSAQLGRRGWRTHRDTPPVGRFTRGRALAVVNTIFLTRVQRRLGERVYELVVDSRGGRS